VKAKNFDFEPAVIHVKAGEKIQLKLMSVGLAALRKRIDVNSVRAIQHGTRTFLHIWR